MDTMSTEPIPIEESARQIMAGANKARVLAERQEGIIRRHALRVRGDIPAGETVTLEAGPELAARMHAGNVGGYSINGEDLPRTRRQPHPWTHQQATAGVAECGLCGGIAISPEGKAKHEAWHERQGH